MLSRFWIRCNDPNTFPLFYIIAHKTKNDKYFSQQNMHKTHLFRANRVRIRESGGFLDISIPLCYNIEWFVMYSFDPL